MFKSSHHRFDRVRIQMLLGIAGANNSLVHRLTAAVIANINTNFLLDLILLIMVALRQVPSFRLPVITSNRASSSTCVLCYTIFYQTTPSNHTSFSTHHPSSYVMVYRTRYTNYSVNTFLGSNRDRTVSIFLRSIRSVTTLLFCLLKRPLFVNSGYGPEKLQEFCE